MIFNNQNNINTQSISKVVLYIYLIIYIVSTFLFSTNIPLGPWSINISIILCLPFLFFLLNKRRLKKLMQNIFTSKITFYNLLVLFVVYVVIASIIAILLHGGSIISFLTNMLALVVQVVFPIIILSEIFYYHISEKLFIKILVCLSFFVFIMGILDFIFNYFNIDIINYILKMFHTRWLISPEVYNDKVFVGKLPRVQSIYDEPSQLGWFILLFSPILNNIVLKIKKIFKNDILNNLTKVTLIPLLWINIFLTLSPMMIILTILSNMFYLYSIISKSSTKRLLNICFVIFLVFTVFFVKHIDSIDMEENSPIKRVATTLSSITDVNELAKREGSLAYRIIININNLIVATQHPIIGVGWGQLKFYMFKQLVKSKFDMPRGLIIKIYSEDSAFYQGFGYRIFCETGTIGLLIFLYFVLRIVFKLNKYKKYKIIKTNLRIFLETLPISILFTLFLLFYDVNYQITIIWYIYGFSIAILNHVNKDLKQYNQLVENNINRNVE